MKWAFHWLVWDPDMLSFSVPETLLITFGTDLVKSPSYFCSLDVNAKQLFICFSKSVFWLVCLLSNYYCAAITQAQFIEWNAVNFLLALGGYGLFFLLLGANFFFLLPSLTSCLGAWLYREAAEVSIRGHWLHFCYPSPSSPPIHHYKLPDHIHFRLGESQTWVVLFNETLMGAGRGEMLFKHY